MFDSKKLLRCHVVNIHNLDYKTDFLLKFGDPVVKNPKVGNTISYNFLIIIIPQWQCMICLAMLKFERSSIAAHLTQHKLDIMEYEAEYGGPDDHEMILPQSSAHFPDNPAQNISRTPLGLSAPAREFGGSIQTSQTGQGSTMSGFSEAGGSTASTDLSQIGRGTSLSGTSQQTTAIGLNGTGSATPSVVSSLTRQCTTVQELGNQTAHGATLISGTKWRTPSTDPIQSHSGSSASSPSWMDIPPLHPPVGQLLSSSSCLQAPPIIPTSGGNLSNGNG